MRTRFAPSPTGPLHLGHAFSALTAWDRARGAGGGFLLRIEDIDRARCRPAFEAGIYEDLRWLGLDWPPVLRQSERGEAYRAALDHLDGLGLLYPCDCTRARIALAAPQEGGDQPTLYPGTCRGRTDRPADAALRLDLRKAIAHLGGARALSSLRWRETGPDCSGFHALDAGALMAEQGDIVLARRDIGTSYHLAVVVDDAGQGITHVVRGADLLPATPLHRLLQALLGLPVPDWHHHHLIRDSGGKRLAKRDAARALSLYRAEGATPADLRALLGLGQDV